MKIRGSMKVRVITLVASVALLGGTAIVASGQTGAFFSDSHSGNIGGNVGSILVNPDSPTTVNFTNLLPGVPQTVQVNYHNSGTSPEDVYLTFPNGTALSALNNLGRYGSVIVANGVGTVFQSYNLNDNLTRCGSFGNTPLTGPSSACNPLPNQVLIASNVAPTASETFTFTFEYASAITGPPSVPWNSFPLPGDNNNSLAYAACLLAPLGSSSTCSDNQTTVNVSDGVGTGLPFALVATQVGILPGAPGSKF